MVRLMIAGRWIAAAGLVALLAGSTGAAEDEGFISLFDGDGIDQWRLVNGRGPGYVVEDGILVCPADGGGNLFTKKEFANFVLRFDFKLQPGGNNGVGLRAPIEGDAAYQGMEIQILDDDADRYAKLRPTQYCGSVYDVFPAKRGSLKPAGQWNSEEIICDGRKIKITINGKVVVDANLDDVNEATLKKHPGLKRSKGHIGFLGHGTRVEFRNIRIKEL